MPSTRRVRKRPEQAFQHQVANYLTHALPEDAWFSAFPAGGGGRLRGAILKGMGLKAGVPDILIIWNGETIWLELKAPKGRLSETQTACMERLRIVGCAAFEVRTLADVAGVLMMCGMPLRARVAA